MSVDAINDEHGTTRGGDVALHRNHTVLDIAHKRLRIKTPLFVVVVPILVQIRSAWLEGSYIQNQHHIGQRQGASLGKNEHGRSQCAIPPVQTYSRELHTTLGTLLVFVGRAHIFSLGTHPL